MADPPLYLADLQVSAALTDNWGRPTAYSQRWWNDNNRRITASFAGVTAALAELATQQATLTAQQAQLTAQQATLTAQQATLTSQQAQLTAQQSLLSGTITGIIGSSLSGAILTDGSGRASWTHGFSPSFTLQLSNCQAFTTGTTIFTVQMIQVTGGPGGTLDLIFWDASGAPAASQFVPVTLHVGL